MKRLLSFPLILLLNSVYAQVSLDSCINMAFGHFKYEEESRAYLASSELAEENAQMNWYPQLMLDGNFTYQNENLSIPISVPGFEAPTVPLNFNRLLVQFSQTIYDGSMTSHQKKLEQSKYRLMEGKLEVEKIQLKSKVITLYISLLLIDDQTAIITSKINNINQRMEVLKRASEFGAAAEVNLISLEAKLLTIDQQIVEIQQNKKALLRTFGQMCGVEMTDETDFIYPEIILSTDNNVNRRPEISLLHSQIENYELQKDFQGTKRLPTINAFGSFGAGLPGYDIFNDAVRPMGLIGIGLKWRLWDWGKIRNEMQLLGLQQQIVQSQEVRIRTQLLGELVSQEEEINKYNTLLKSDDHMIALRNRVSTIKAAELENGTITATDYITELDQEEEACLNQKIHELKLLLAKLNYQTLQGN
ncbi:MAG: TolC family protein [Bacteroidetes bacterium]|nr:TolC family protein [Bacteroidota bacterium]MDA1121294.1 TolC family protein [Bacteroidota bacterium]